MKKLGIAILCTLVSLPSRAHASADASVARALFEEGIRLYEKGAYAESCAKLESSQQIIATVGTALNLGRCNEAMGKVVAAWTEFDHAALLARRDGDPKRSALALQNADRLRARLPLLRVSSHAAGARFQALLDGVTLDAATLDVAIPVEVGHHTFEARALGRKPFVADFDAVAGSEAHVEVPWLEATLPARAPLRSASTEGAPFFSTPHIRYAAVGVATLGAIATVTGLVFGARAASLDSDSSAHCTAAGCDARGRSLLLDAGSTADTSTAFVSVGVGLLALGVAGWLAAPSLGGGRR